MTKREKVAEWLKELENDELVAVWNSYAYEHDIDNIIYDFDDNFFEENFSRSIDAVRAWHFGPENNTWNAPYIKFTGYGNLETLYGDYGELECYFDDYFLDYIIENADDYKSYGLDLDETESEDE